MPSGWEVYYVVFLSALVALVLPLCLAALSSLLARPKKATRLDVSHDGSMQSDKLPGEGLAVFPPVESVVGRKINTRFFLSANAALVLIAMSLILIPCVVTVKAGNDRTILVKGLVGIISVASLAALGLVYSARKGDLDWLRSYRSPK